MKKIKTLYFEGAGCVPCNDVANCRIRTAFTNNDGKKIYIELAAASKRTKITTGKNGRKLKRERYIIEKGFIFCWHCHYITDDKEIDDCNCNKLPCERKETIYKYTNEEILNYVNKNCNCSFDKIVVLDNLAGYRVFADEKKNSYNTFKMYNYGDEFLYDVELTNKRIKKVKELSEHFKNVFNQKYDNTSYYIKDEKLMICINVEEEKRINAGYKNREFEVEV